MTKVKKPANPAVILTARDLDALTASVIPHAETDRTFPLLGSVLIRSAGDYVTAIATDRYRIALKRLVPAERPDNGFRAVVPVAALKQIKTIFRARRDHDPALRLVVDEDSLVVTVIDGLTGADFGAATGAYLRFALTVGEYPKIDKLVRKALDAKVPDEAFQMTVNPTFLASFKAGQPSAEPMQVTPTGENQPWLIRVGDDFIGLLVPVRFGGGETANTPESWDVLLDAVDIVADDKAVA